MKKFKILLILLMCPFLGGCGETEKIAIDHVEFLTILNEYDYTINSYTAEYAYADAAYGIAEDDLNIFYLDGKKTNDVEGIFLDECKNAYNEAGADYKKKTKGDEDWLVLELKTKDKYFYLSMIEDTYIIAKGSIDKQELVEEIMDKLGY